MQAIITPSRKQKHSRKHATACSGQSLRHEVQGHLVRLHGQEAPLRLAIMLTLDRRGHPNPVP